MRSLRELDSRDPNYATRFVAELLQSASDIRASDIHLQPLATGLQVLWRLDGVLQTVGEFPRGESADVVTRLKVLADLLTYRSDVPQEGRLRTRIGNFEMRVSTFPTLYGERAVVRLFARADQLLHLDDLGLPDDIRGTLLRSLQHYAGAILLAGPAGSGKTTTLYACLREIMRTTQQSRSIVTIEDPIEVSIAGVAQSQINPAVGFDLATGLRSILRQDPEVVMVGEIRDRGTAEGVFGAALTGHLVLSSFHAGSAVEALTRLAEMGIEPYLLRSGLRAILQQRLVRRLCECATPSQDADAAMGLAVKTFRVARGCERCQQTGYRGRVVVAELLLADSPAFANAALARRDVHEFEKLAIAGGMMSRWRRAADLIERGLTSPAEVRRVLGFATMES